MKDRQREQKYKKIMRERRKGKVIEKKRESATAKNRRGKERTIKRGCDDKMKVYPFFI